MNREQRHMIRFERGKLRFNLRLVAVIVVGERVLLHRAAGEDFWTLPGGRAELMEPARAGLAREMLEELETQALVGRLLWVVENFFNYIDTDYHEYALYFSVSLPPDCPLLLQDTFKGREEDIELIFRWFGLDELPSIHLLPGFLKTALAHPPEGTEYVVHYDE